MGYMICGIYERRPEVCKRYPEPGSYQPPTCTYYFTAEGRQGSCSPECNSSCCMLPREGGEPGGGAMPEIAGGRSCRYLEYVAEHPAHKAKPEPKPEPVPDRGGSGAGPGGGGKDDSQALNPVEDFLGPRENA
jgi:hypothetical protein